MIGVIDRLLQGDQEIARRFAAAKAFWDDFHLAHRNDDEEALARVLGSAQDAYENDVWDMNRYLGKTTMPWTAVAALYDGTAGFEDNRPYAARLLRAFQSQACMCSGEVKSCAEDAMAVYQPED